MADLEKMVDDLSGLTVIEAADLVKKLEDKWDVSAAAPAAVAVAGPAGGESAEEEQDSFDVMLVGDGGKKIWITELGAPTGNSPMAVTEDAQAAIIGSSLSKASSLPYIGPVFVHSLRDSGLDPADAEQNYGLLRFDFSHKPAFGVVRGS